MKTGKYMTLTDGFWAERLGLIQRQVLPYQWKALNDEIPGAEPSHAIENFRIASGEKTGEFHGHFFQDSDVAKWLEAAGHCLAHSADPELETMADGLIELIVGAQQPDGYLNTYFTVKGPDEKWTNLRDAHELYCAGHMIEAAVTYYEATGKRKLLDAACRMTDHIDTVFGPEEGKSKGYPGHEEIELALLKLYRTTGRERYLALCKFFIDQRRKEPNYFRMEAERRGNETPYPLNYSQSHLPVRQQTEATGHAVRAAYLYCAMTDMAMESGDQKLKDACERLWESATDRRMYVTGGIGSQARSECFTLDYDLPGDTAYAETCAAIGLVLWAQRMLKLKTDRRFADVMERALYNGVLSGMSLDGMKYFYVNPLTVRPEACEKRFDHRHVKTERQPWFGCACCPPNIARLIASVPQYICSSCDNTIYVHLYASSEGTFTMSHGGIKLTQKTDYPWDGRVLIMAEPESAEELECTVALRIPGWCRSPALKLNESETEIESRMISGYLYLNRRWRRGDRIELMLPMPVQRIRANPRVGECAGRVALQRGPLLYCLEEKDNGPNLDALCLPADAPLVAEPHAELPGGVITVRCEALRIVENDWRGELYAAENHNCRKTAITAVPYFAWNNRGAGEMQVWIRETGSE